MKPDASNTPPSRGFFRIVGRSLRLRCPRCGQGRLFVSGYRMPQACDHCSHRFEREPGFYLGAIYFNYGLTALITTIAYPLMRWSWGIDARTALIVLLFFVVLFPFIFFRHARSLWLGFDEFWDPQGS